MRVKIKSFLVLFVFFLASLSSYSQSGFIVKTDTLDSEKYGFFSIPEIDYEIERINNYLNSTSQIIDEMNHQLDGDTAYVFLLNQIKAETIRFNSYDETDLSSFFLENSHRTWSSFKKRLLDIKKRSFELLKKSEERNVSLEKQETTWEKTHANSENHKIPDIQLKKIRLIQKRINKQHNENYKISLRIINREAKLNSEFVFIESMLTKIERLQDKYKEDLFKRSAAPIWKITLSDSTNRSLLEGLTLAWKDNTKGIFRDYVIYGPMLERVLLYAFLLFIFHFILRKRYHKKFGFERMDIAGDFKYLILHSPITSYISTVVLLFFVVFENIPLAIANTISLFLLMMLYLAVKDYISEKGKKLIKAFILLMLLNIFEIVIWYIGDYSRLYLVFETAIGVVLLYKFVTPAFSREELPHLRHSKYVAIVRYPIFALIVIAFFANLFGYLNVTIFNQRVAIQFTIILIEVVGVWFIINSYIQILSDVLSRIDALKLNSYLPLLKKRTIQFFRLYFIYILLNSMLNLFDVKSQFYKALLLMLDEVQVLGSISFTYGDILSFILILLVTWGITSLISIILDEDNYKKYDSIRGIPSAISMTLRILFFTTGLFFAFSAAGFDMTSLGLIVSALGVGIGFGLQNVVNNYISGLILIYERPVQKGDTVEVNNLLGDVVDIGIRRSTVRTFDGAEVIIPNSLLTSNQLINWTLSDKHRRLDISVGVAYGTDPTLVIDIMKKVAEDNTNVVKIPKPMVLFDEFGDSSLNFRLLCWVLFDNSMSTRSSLRVAISKVFEENNIEIPFPQMDLHVKDTPSGFEENKKDSTDKPKPSKLMDEAGDGSHADE